MRHRPLDRAPGAFQRPVAAEVLRRIGRSTFDAEPVSATELGHGAYNTTYALEFPDGRRAILRVAPEPDRQFRSERFLLRAEHAATPFLAGLGPLVPRILAADFTHQLLGRDYLITSVLPGRPAAEALGGWPRPERAPFFRDLGAIAARIHSVAGPAFGPLAGPASGTWSAALAAAFADLAADLAGVGNTPAATAVTTVAAAADAEKAVLDEITEPRLLHGDLWTVNTMIADGPEPRVCGVFDHDRAWWGDPLADWPLFMVGRKPGAEREAFWDAYPRPEPTPGNARRARYYLARHRAAVVLEHHRLGDTAAAETATEELLAVAGA